MDEEILSQLVQNQSLDDEVLFLNPDIQVDDHNYSSEHTTHNTIGTVENTVIEQDNEEIEENTEIIDMEEIDSGMISWSRKLEDEPCCISVHPEFPKIPHVAIGTCGDTCQIYDFQHSHSNTNEALRWVLGPFEETVSCCAFSPDGQFLALGTLNSSLILYSITHTVNRVGTTDNVDTTNTVTTDSIDTTHKVDTVDYVMCRELDTTLLTVDWLCFSVDSRVVCCSGEGGLLLIHHIHANSTQYINTHLKSHYGIITSYPTLNSGNTVNSGTVNSVDTLDTVDNVTVNSATVDTYVLMGAGDKLMIVSLNENYQQKNITAVNSGTDTRDTAELSDEITIVSASDRVRMCCYGTMSGVVSFVNIPKATAISTFTHHRDSVESILFPENSVDLCVTADLTGLVVFYNVNTMCVVGKVDVSSGVTRVLSSSLSNKFIVSTVNGTVALLTMNKIVREVKLHKAPITDFQLLKLPNEEYVITIGQDHTLTV
uniref:Anaphase-promoting complex subunit 4 WD40 domain-containing protein n=2 Tax=Theileria parva TaxID=5875 RepID=Q4N8C6_THEPA|eukprot:XP_766065.1 hypothetical protein [Theileria parva strain Muguga]